MLTTTQKHAVRAFAHIFNKTAELAEIAASADAGFDGGEWSRGWHCTQIEIAHDDILQYVAQRFGITADELYCAVNEMEMVNELHFLRAIGVFAKEVTL
jgi:hypothetical protein